MLQWLREQGSCYLADSDSVHSDADAGSDWKSCIIAVNAAIIAAVGKARSG